jgi:hypothetical protein
MRPARPPPGLYRLFAKFASIDDRPPVLLMSPDLTGDHSGQLEVRALRARILAAGHPMPALSADCQRLQLCYSPYIRIHPSIPYTAIDRALSSTLRPVQAHWPRITTGWPPQRGSSPPRMRVWRMRLWLCLMTFPQYRPGCESER